MDLTYYELAARLAALAAACDRADESTGALTTEQIRAGLAGHAIPDHTGGPHGFRGRLADGELDDLAQAIHEGGWEASGGEWRWSRARPAEKRLGALKARAAARLLGLRVDETAVDPAAR